MDIVILVVSAIVSIVMIVAQFRLFAIASTLREILEELRIQGGRANVTAAEEARKKWRGVYVEPQK